MITDSFDIQTRPIISLKDIYGEQKKLADCCIVTFSKVIFDTLLKEQDCEQIGEAFTHCNSLQQLAIPDSVTEIAPTAFFQSKQMKKLIGSAGSCAKALAASIGAENEQR